jgi:hypothetical protein
VPAHETAASVAKGPYSRKLTRSLAPAAPNAPDTVLVSLMVVVPIGPSADSVVSWVGVTGMKILVAGPEPPGPELPAVSRVMVTVFTVNVAEALATNVPATSELMTTVH